MGSLNQRGPGGPYFSGCSDETTGLVAFQVQIYFSVSPTVYTLLECLFITEETKGYQGTRGLFFGGIWQKNCFSIAGCLQGFLSAW